MQRWQIAKQDFKNIKKIYNLTTRYISNKINLEYYAYLEKIKNNWSISGGEMILQNNLADKIIVIK